MACAFLPAQGGLSPSGRPLSEQLQAPVSLKRDQADKAVYLWAIDRLSRQVVGLGATPAVHMPPA